MKTNQPKWVKCRHCILWPRDVDHWDIRQGECLVSQKKRWPDIKRICTEYEEDPEHQEEK